jgi:hypothetical protein
MEQGQVLQFHSNMTEPESVGDVETYDSILYDGKLVRMERSRVRYRLYLLLPNYRRILVRPKCQPFSFSVRSR